jgi:predicted GNAT family acetyltransferase
MPVTYNKFVRAAAEPGSIDIITITNSGNNYTNGPTQNVITITGDGTGAVLKANVSNNKVQNIIIMVDDQDITSEDDVPGLGKMNIVIKDNEIIVGDIFIPEKYRKQGIATIVYQKISDYFNLPIVSSKTKGFNQTIEGGHIWKKRERFEPKNLQENIRRILREELEDFNSETPYIYDNPKLVQMIEKVMEPSSFICSYVTSAIKMLEGDKIKVYGFSVMENPDAEYFVEDYGDDSDEGHHFAVMNGRYIIDPWVYDNFDRSVFDLQSKEDEDIIRYIYGDVNKWTDITNRVDNFKLLFPKTYKKLIEFYNKII